MAYRAVLFDWMLTLAHYPRPEDLLRRAGRALGREVDVDALAAGMRRAQADPDVVDAMRRVDCSPDEHLRAEMLLLRTAGLDELLADAYYDLIGRPETHPIYPEVGRVLRQLRESRVRIGIVSDIHVDLREHARLAGIDKWISNWTLSFELGVQKPDPEMYRHALEGLRVAPHDALMLGDRHTVDGAASRYGIDALILPDRGRDPAVPDNRLAGVVRLAT
ncbi:MAG: HAD family hydrolase [Actinomycetota bacterium]